LLLDEAERPIRWLDERALQRTDRELSQLGLEVVAKVEPQATLRDTLEEMLTGNAGCAVVVDGRGSFQGVIEIETLADEIKSMQAAARRHYEQLESTGEAHL
jgi:osmoprotectant transport system ATP-binding protein